MRVPSGTVSSDILLGIAYATSGVDVIPGSLAALYTDADALTHRAETYESGADRLRSVNAGQWVGAASDAFDDARDSTREQLLAIADTCTATAGALRAHGDMLTWAQGVGDGLVDEWQRADALAAAGTARKRGIDLALAEVRAQVASSARNLAQALRAASDLVPPEPTFWSELAGGTADAFGDLLLLVRQQNTIRKIIDPQGWANDTALMVSGFRDSLNDPKEFAKDSLDWDTWANSPPTRRRSSRSRRAGERPHRRGWRDPRQGRDDRRTPRRRRRRRVGQSVPGLMEALDPGKAEPTRCARSRCEAHAFPARARRSAARRSSSSRGRSPASTSAWVTQLRNRASLQ